MPVLRAGMPKAPPGFEVISDQLDTYEEEMKQAVQEESKGVVGQTARAGRAAKRSRDDDDGDNGGINEEEAEPVEGETAATPLPPLWRVAQINQARTRYVFDAYVRERRISKEVYDYCCEMGFIDGGLAKRWRLAGYERLCCVACGVPGSASIAASITAKYALRDKQERRSAKGASGTGPGGKATCVCRVPAAQRKNKSFVACAVCGCHGCCSADASGAPSATATIAEN